MILTSPVFKNGEEIPMGYTADGDDLSPPLEWSDAPPEVREFVLICEDPDAPAREGMDSPFVHWLLYHISGAVSYLPAGLHPNELRITIPVSVEQGTNSYGKVGYQGPKPPAGQGVHHYHFTLYALDARLGVRPALTKARLLKAMAPHIIAKAELVGIYERKAERLSA